MHKKITSIFEMLILIIAIIAFSYSISENFATVSAETLPIQGCCKKTNNGALCMNTINTECNESFSPLIQYTQCENTPDCKLGCCINKGNGQCSLRTPKTLCESGNAKWVDNADCSIQECLRGCCVLGTQSQFTTEGTCSFLSTVFGLQKDFRKQIANEAECIALSYSTEEVACVFEQLGESKCRFITQQECRKIPGSRMERGKFCSDVMPECIAKTNKKCVDGKDSVYWFDSCGNKESIPEDGKCDRFTGSTCGINTLGSAYCKSLDCQNVPANINGGKTTRKNGESWCVYESKVGDGKDVPGTTHYKYYCLDGDVQMEKCREARTEICEENEINSADNTMFSQARCSPNLAYNCIQLNIQKANGEITNAEMIKECNDNPHCRILSFSGKLNPTATFCAPKNPRGALDTNSVGAQTICAIGSYTCQKVEECNSESCASRDTEKGDNCGTEATKQLANEWCKSMGDCGVDTNVEGKVTQDGLNIKVAMYQETESLWSGGTDKERRNWVDTMANPNIYQANADWDGTALRPGNFSKIISASSSVEGALTLPGAEGYEERNTGMDDAWGTILGAGGLAWVSGAVAVSGEITWSTFTTTLFVNSENLAGASQYFYVAMTTIIGALVGYLFAQLPGISAEEEEWLVGLGAAAGLIYGLWTLAPTTSTTPIGWIALGIVALVALIMSWIGGGFRQTTYTYECKPWQPPEGGSDCEKCNLDTEKCTKYKCESLGQACKYEGQSGLGKCFWLDPNDQFNPTISPNTALLAEHGLRIDQQTDNGIKISKNGDCLNQFSNLNIGVTTNEEARCKYSLNSTGSYDTMPSEMQGAWSFNHTIDTSFADYLSGEISVYVRCSDRNGKKNPIDYILRTCVEADDLTAPIMMSSNPENGAYIKYGVEKINLTVFFNEPSECKWSKVDKAYESMENNFINSPISFGLTSYPSFAEISGLANEENHVYVRCKDGPGKNESERNANSQSIDIKLLKTLKPLNVTITSPSGEITFGREINVELKAETYDGANGNAKCKYSFTGYETMVLFFTTGGSEHTQNFNLMSDGQHTIYVECIDEALNKARTKATFTVKRDTTSPAVVRTYKKDSSLYIETNEESTCTYSFDDCKFDFANGIAIPGIGKEHEIQWKTGKTYNIKCQDFWGNTADDCSIKLRVV